MLASGSWAPGAETGALGGTAGSDEGGAGLSADAGGGDDRPGRGKGLGTAPLEAHAALHAAQDRIKAKRERRMGRPAYRFQRGRVRADIPTAGRRRRPNALETILLWLVSLDSREPIGQNNSGLWSKRSCSTPRTS